MRVDLSNGEVPMLLLLGLRPFVRGLVLVGLVLVRLVGLRLLVEGREVGECGASGRIAIGTVRVMAAQRLRVGVRVPDGGLDGA